MLITFFTLLEKWYIWSPLKWAWSKRNDKCYPTVYIRITAFRVDKIKASECEKSGRGRKVGLGVILEFSGPNNKQNAFLRFIFD